MDEKATCCMERAYDAVRVTKFIQRQLAAPFDVLHANYARVTSGDTHCTEAASYACCRRLPTTRRD